MNCTRDCWNSGGRCHEHHRRFQRDKRARVLIVDDLPANLGVLHTCLHDAGYKVLVATGGDKALAQLDDARPDLILLDVSMPGMDGYETCRRLKADARWAEVPVLFLTAQGDPVDKMQGFAVGAVDYITKPLHPGEVLARVRAHLEIRALPTNARGQERFAGSGDGVASGSREAAPAIPRPGGAGGGRGRERRVLHASGAAAPDAVLS